METKNINKMDLSTLSDEEILKLPQFRNKKGNISWLRICKSEDISEKFLERYIHRIKKCFISERKNFSKCFLKKYQRHLDLKYIFQNAEISEDIIEEFANQFNINIFLKTSKLSEPFIEKYFNKIDKNLLMQYQNVSEEFVKKHINEFVNANINLFKYNHLFDVDYVLNDGFIFDINYISKNINIPENLLIKYFHKLNKDDIALYQNFSHDFYITYEKFLNKEHVCDNKNLSKDTFNIIQKNDISEFKDLVEKSFDEIKLSWTRWFTDIVIAEEINKDISAYNNVSDFFKDVDKQMIFEDNEGDYSDQAFIFSQNISCLISLYHKHYYPELFDNPNVDKDSLFVPDYIINWAFEYCIDHLFCDYKFETNLLEIFDPLQCFLDNYKGNSVNVFGNYPIEPEKFINNKNIPNDVKEKISSFLLLL